MTTNHPYASLAGNEVPRLGSFLGDDDLAYPLVDRIETLLYPVHDVGPMQTVPQKIVIHPQIIGRIRDEDVVGKPKEIKDDLGVKDEVLTLTPDAVERIVREVVAHFEA